ncbi:MAG TPA: hypothetical protein VG753_01490 [Candidatus Paceibacterota bacterium]|nr:hypothetical protein [Candidatus Paceibacterota bacterium]
MPFVAIALALTLFIGGSAVVADNTAQGHAAVAHVAHAWESLQAKVTGHTDVDASANADAKTAPQATTTTQAHNGLMIRSDVDASGSANANANQGVNLNADGSVKVNVF